MNFPDTTALDPAWSLSGDVPDFAPRSPGLPPEPPGAGTAVAGWQGHPPSSSPALGRTAPFLSAPRPAWLHQSRRRATHVERGVQSVRRARRLGDALSHRVPYPERPFSPPTSSLPIARSPSKLAPSILCLPPYGNGPSSLPTTESSAVPSLGP